MPWKKTARLGRAGNGVAHGCRRAPKKAAHHLAVSFLAAHRSRVIGIGLQPFMWEMIRWAPTKPWTYVMFSHTLPHCDETRGDQQKTHGSHGSRS